MIFMQLLKSLDDLLYELMSWLVFYPITLWRALRHPWGMMEYAGRELSAGEHHQYDDTLRPPMFLLVSLMLSHAIELTAVGESKLVTSNKGIAALVSDDTSLLMLRLLTFSIFPLVMAVRLVVLKHSKLTRDTLKRPFFAQCYPAGPFALLVGLSGVLLQLEPRWAPVAGLLLLVITLIWYGSLQARWFARALKVSIFKALWIASVSMVICILAIAVTAPLLG